jgi:hypothetical protein
MSTISCAEHRAGDADTVLKHRSVLMYILLPVSRINKYMVMEIKYYIWMILATTPTLFPWPISLEQTAPTKSSPMSCHFTTDRPIAIHL